MSIPLDRLYHYLHDVVNHDLVIYGWFPHGSRKLEDLQALEAELNKMPADWSFQQSINFFHHSNSAPVIFHDQEPLKFDYYNTADYNRYITLICQQSVTMFPELAPCVDSLSNYSANLGLRGCIAPANNFDKTILVHSELQSSEVRRYCQNGYIPVYYWSHGLIAQDWYRFAPHDARLEFNVENVSHDFLVYCRAWSGTREYRLTFAEAIVNAELPQHCKMSFAVEDQQHYTQHQFQNPQLQTSRTDLEHFFMANTHSANASADYNTQDYSTTGIEIVLETLFDDSRWHLTEKTLRAIACAKPFLLMAPAGSLEYLHGYGFKTFAGLIDETYDTIPDPRQRMQAVINEMKKISQLSPEQKRNLFVELHHIAKQNQKLFFGNFFQHVVNEYKTNLDQAMIEMYQNRSGLHIKNINTLLPAAYKLHEIF